ncbi:MAG: DUF929 family protein [Gammaproteobacteria bacterium]
MPRLSSIVTIALVAFAAPALAAGPFGSAGGGTPPALAKNLNQPVPASLIATLEKASKDGLGLGATPDRLVIKAVDGPRIASGDKVGLLYVGADFCPYCAGQRWAIVLTLLRFGKLNGAEYMLSSPKDAYPNTPTFSFQHAKYTSKYLDFVPVETADRNGRVLMRRTKAQSDIFNKFDAPPYSQIFGGIPFIYLDGQYIITLPMLLPGDLSGMDWQAAATALANPESAQFQKVMPQVNVLTAAICRLDGGNPDDVCSAPGVTAGNGALLRLSAGGS